VVVLYVVVQEKLVVVVSVLLVADELETVVELDACVVEVVDVPPVVLEVTAVVELDADDVSVLVEVEEPWVVEVDPPERAK